MPASIVRALPPGAAGRVAIIGGETEQLLAVDIKNFLVDSFRVPNERWRSCLKDLREEARIRIKGAGGGRWHREDLERIIRKHEGYLASSHELEHYVYPTNWAQLRETLKVKHAALIVGQSGTGKTMATRKLFEDLRKELSGLSRVAIQHGPHQLNDDKTEQPVLYDIEDPWGRFDFVPDSRPWNDQLAKLFSQATSGRLMVATTRRDVAFSAGVLESVKSWLVPLEAEHYGESERIKLYQSRIAALPRELQALAGGAQSTVLGELGTPLQQKQ